MSRVPEELDVGLIDRLRRVVAGEVATETELRTLADEAGGWARALRTEWLKHHADLGSPFEPRT